MRDKRKNTLNCILTIALAVSITGQSILAEATTISDIQDQITEHENQLEDINDQLDVLAGEQDLLQEMIDDLNAEIINAMASIGVKEEELAAKELELDDKQVQLDQKQVEIDEAQLVYEEAKAREEQQYQDMLVWIKLMYENRNVTYLGLFLKGSGLADMLNHMDYIEKVYEYGMQKLEEYEATKEEVHNLWEQLVAEKEQLASEKTQLESEKSQLLAAKSDLEAQKKSLDAMLAKKKRESSNYDAEIKKYQQEAAVAQRLLRQERAQLAQLQAQQNQGNTPAANGDYKTTDYTKIIDNATGSDLGKKVAKYACQYIGNPYVYGGTSLTNGADCSGFIYRVYSDFGYSLPRTSYEQRSAGKAVEYSNAQPGDIVCYDGHVGIYIGDGKIVHASNSKPYPSGGIKVSLATYRTILAVRRII